MAMAWGPGGARKPPQKPQPQRPPVGVAGAEPGNSGPYVPGTPGQGKPILPQQTQRPRMQPGGGGQSPPYIPSFPMPGPSSGGMKPDVMPEKPPMGGEKPAWQILAENGIKGQGSAAGNRAALAGLPQQAQGIDGAIQSLRAQLGQGGGQGGMVGQALQGYPNSPGMQLGGGPFGGPGSDLGFQSGGGLMAPTFPPGDGAGQPGLSGQPQNPYLDILRQRLGGGMAPQATQFAQPGASRAGMGRFAY